jgi:hypothetical protein
MILTRLLIYPRYVVRPLAVSAERYLAGSFARPLLVAVLAIGLGALVPSPASPNLAGLLTGFAVHGVIYCAFAYCLSLTREDRRVVRAVVARPLAQMRSVQISERVP